MFLFYCPRNSEINVHTRICDAYRHTTLTPHRCITHNVGVKSNLATRISDFSANKTGNARESMDEWIVDERNEMSALD